MLMDHGAMVDKADNQDWTPLFAAAQVSDSLQLHYVQFLMFTKFFKLSVVV